MKQALSFPINASYYKYLLWYDNMYVGLEALKNTTEHQYTFSKN